MSVRVTLIQRREITVEPSSTGAEAANLACALRERVVGGVEPIFAKTVSASIALRWVIITRAGKTLFVAMIFDMAHLDFRWKRTGIYRPAK